MASAVRFAASLLTKGMELLPASVVLGIVRRVPKLHVAIPPGIKAPVDYYLGDVKVNIDTTYVIERAMLSGRYDPQTLSVIRRSVLPGDTCLDVGANVGAIAFALAKQAGPRGSVLAFEPGLLTYGRMQDNLALNPELGKVIRPFCMGLSDQEGRLYWHEHAANRGNANLSSEAGEGAVPVRVTTVDTWFRENPGPRLDFVKIDVESMEYEVIRGGMETWAAFRPVLYYETLPAFEAFRGKPVFRMIEDMLKPLGYSFYRLGKGDRLEETAYPHLGANTLALPESRKGRILAA